MSPIQSPRRMEMPFSSRCPRYPKCPEYPCRHVHQDPDLLADTELFARDPKLHKLVFLCCRVPGFKDTISEEKLAEMKVHLECNARLRVKMPQIRAEIEELLKQEMEEYDLYWESRTEEEMEVFMKIPWFREFYEDCNKGRELTMILKDGKLVEVFSKVE